MLNLLVSRCQGGYHGQQCLEGGHGEPTTGGLNGDRRQAGSGHRDDTLDAGIEPHDTHAAEPLFGGEADEREGEAVERMGRISDLNALNWWCR
jgi:hypothetical protein